MVGVLFAFAVVFFLAVTGLSHVYHAQQESLGKRWFVRGNTELTAGRFGNSVSDFRAALFYARNDYSYQLELAEALVGLKRTSEAQAYLGAARARDDGAAIFGAFSGSAFQLNRGALLVNPYDTRAVAEALGIACDMPPVEQKKRIRKLKARIRHEDIFHWRDLFWGCGELGTRSPLMATARSVEQKSADV